MPSPAIRHLVLAAALLLVGTASAAFAAGTEPERLTLVAGASGRTGGYVLQELERRGHAIRAGTTDVGRARRGQGARADWVALDVREPRSVAEAMQGVDYVICAIGASEWQGPNSPEFVDYGGVRNLVDAAVAAKVRHFVLVSSAAAGPFRSRSTNLQMGHVRHWKTRGENHLKRSGLAYTIIGPGGLEDAPASGGGLRVMSRGDYRGGLIARGDVALLAVDALEDPAARNKSFAAVRDAGLPQDAWRGLLADLPPDAGGAEAPPAVDDPLPGT